MLINVCFDDEDNAKNVDIVEMPDEVEDDIENIYAEFLKWMFDKKNNHGYWIKIDGQNRGCSYDTEAFVNWVNKYVYQSNKAIIKEKNIPYSKGNPHMTIFF